MAVLQCGYKVWPWFCTEKPESFSPYWSTQSTPILQLWLHNLVAFQRGSLQENILLKSQFFLICQILSTLKFMCELWFPLTNLPVVLSEWRKEKNPRHSILCVSSGLCRQLWNCSLVMWTVLWCRSEPYLVEAKLRDTFSLSGIVRSFQIALCF